MHCCTNKSRQPSGFEDEHSCFCCCHARYTLVSSMAVQVPEQPQDCQESKHKKLSGQVRLLGLSAGTWNKFPLHTSVFSCLLKLHVLHSTGHSPSFQDPYDFSIFHPLHVSITDQPQFKRFGSTYLFFLTHSKFQYE